MSTFHEKYLKYKEKYLALKNQLGGVCDCGKPECPGCDRMAASSSVASVAAGNTVNVLTMKGDFLTYDITLDMTIMKLKKLIEDDERYIEPLASRQRLMFMKKSIEPMDDSRTLESYGIVGGDTLDLLVVNDLVLYNDIYERKILLLMRRNDVNRLSYFLSQFYGELAIAERRIENEEAICLGNALRGNTSFSSINLSRNMIGNEGAASLAAAIGDNTSYTNINLSINKIGDEGAIALAKALAMNPSATNINLRKNKIGNEGAAALAEVLVNNTSLETMDLNSNKIGDDGVVALVTAIATTLTMKDHIISLYLVDNNIKQSLQTILRNIAAAHPELVVLRRPGGPNLHVSTTH